LTGLHYNAAKNPLETVSIYTLERLRMPAKQKTKSSPSDLRLPQAKAPGDLHEAERKQLLEAQRLDPDVRRQQILEAAISYFAEAGFAGQTRELSKRIGVTQSLLYRYYPSKQDLIEAVFDAVFLKPWNPAWTRALQDRSQPLRDRLIVFYSDYAQTVYRPEWIRIYMHAGLAGMGLNRNYLQIVRKRLLHVMCRELRCELFGDHPALRTAIISGRELEMIWNLHGSMFYWAVRRNIFSSPEARDFEQRTADAVDLFLAGAASLYPKLIMALKAQKNHPLQTPAVHGRLSQKKEPAPQ
jgi:AcrR family transcriptional regulator